MNGCRVCGISLADSEYIALLDYVNKNQAAWALLSFNQKAELIKKEIKPISLL